MNCPAKPPDQRCRAVDLFDHPARVHQWYVDPFRIDFEFAAEGIKKA